MAQFHKQILKDVLHMTGFAKSEIEPYWLLAVECFIYDLEKSLEQDFILEGHPIVSSKYIKPENIQNFIQDARLPDDLKQRLKNLDSNLQKLANEEGAKEVEKDKSGAENIMNDLHSEWGGATKEEYGAELVRQLFPGDLETQEEVLKSFLEEFAESNRHGTNH